MNRDKGEEGKKIKIEKKSRITSFFLAILVGVAIHIFMTTIEPLLDNINFSFSLKYLILNWSIPLKYFILYLSIPFIFLITIIRFFIGNLPHIIDLEAAVTREKDGISPMMWILDFSIIILEAIIFIFMGMSTCIVNICTHESTPQKFLTIIIILFFVDASWIFSQLILGCLSKRRENQLTFFNGRIKKFVCDLIYFKDCKRDRIPWGWFFLNLISALMMWGVLKTIDLNNIKLFNYLLIIFILLGGLIVLFLEIDKFIVITSTISKMKDSIWKKWLSGIIFKLHDKYKSEDNNIKTLTIVMPWIAGLDLIYFIIIIYYELNYPYDFKLIYLTFITLFLTVAAFIDVMCLDIYKILTGSGKKRKQMELKI